MHFKFDANQEYQLDAIDSVISLFEGQPNSGARITFASGIAAIPNRLDLDENTLLDNLHSIQKRNHITADNQLTTIDETIDTPHSKQSVSFYNFSVEMETGTGKTYVYLRTMLEMYRRYGLRKFIVVVPSRAIREGVLTTLRLTKTHFDTLYNNPPVHFYRYNSSNLSQVRQFTLSDGIEIMVMTLAAFNKASNVIHRTTDRLQGDTPVHLIQAARPILILDEPQNMKSEKSIAALSILNPLFALRYSATHPRPYNMVYRLTPYEAYRQRLVKRIEVYSIVREDATVTPYIRLEEIRARGRTLTAVMTVHKLKANGTIGVSKRTLKPGQSLAKITNRQEYEGYEIDEINRGLGIVRFANNVEISVGQEFGADKEAIFEAQIRQTVQEHFRRQAWLDKQSIPVKVLSLFFIDRVDNYAGDKPVIRRLFDEAFNELKMGTSRWRDKTAAEVQAAYFAKRTTKQGKTIYEDSSSGEAKKDQAAYNLIMKDKEQLLSFEEDVAFIFSHSALREGWDNPNVFQICTLNQTGSNPRKRQEVGRGVRLAVNQNGERIHDDQVNVLTVIANESYEQYVRYMQSTIALEYRTEIEARFGKNIDELSHSERAAIAQEYGEGILPPAPTNARLRGQSRLRKAYLLDNSFKELWQRIKSRTRYNVQIDADKLVRDTIVALNQVKIRPPRIVVTKAEVAVVDTNIFEARQMSATKTVTELVGRYTLPDLVTVMSNLMTYTSPPVRLSRHTLLRIVTSVSPELRKAAVANPHGFATEAVRILKEKLVQQLVDGIEYEKINEWYEMTQFKAEVQAWEDNLIPASKALYDHVIYDSDIERDFVGGLERRHDVKMYVKLPAWFTVVTPVGEYNPDWAIIMNETDTLAQETGVILYLVRETKGTHNRTKWRPDEKNKVACGERHFNALGVDYKVAVMAEELP